MRHVRSDEFTEWQAYFGIEPWGEEWRQTGTLAALFYNAKRKRGAKALTAEDFIHRPYKQKRRQSAQEMMRIFGMLGDALKAAHGR